MTFRDSKWFGGKLKFQKAKIADTSSHPMKVFVVTYIVLHYEEVWKTKNKIKLIKLQQLWITKIANQINGFYMQCYTGLK